eukprot:CAMPEP_0181084354 /NCGR_PEP_ID=MMETSP1071-20121207/4649_1 /TAXON_ID=35127 /ORGANISM="Thalassiosira sp., Strain NH16" /LENGTH=552 /DNA_ID=CAMNT_0023166079 /DNA_START=295 /DNA_END=1953 /DNA_ORIENTATION=+
MKVVTSRTVCKAKLNKVASSFDLEQILSDEKEFTSAEGDNLPTSMNMKRRGRNKGNKKKMMKEKLKKQKMERQQLQKKQKSLGKSQSDGFDIGDGTSGDEPTIEYDNLIQDVRFSAYDVPSSSNGKRIDAALVELLNVDNGGSGNQAPNQMPISRSQCGTLLSHECVFVVPPEDAAEFRSAWKTREMEIKTEGGAAAVPHSLIEQYGSPIKRKSHSLEASSILIYPPRDSLLSASSSSALLSNFIPPTEIIAQKLPLDILYEDEHMIVINKRAGMVVHPAAGNWDMTVVNALAYYLMNESPFGAGEFFDDDAKDDLDSDDSGIANNEADTNQNDAVTNSISTLRPGIVHRLDKGTTGVLVVAKTSSTLAILSEAFADRKVKKEYLAIAIGNPGEDQWINKPIGRHPLHRQRMRVVPDPSSSMSTRGQARLTGPKQASMAKQGRPSLSHIHTIHHDGKLSVVQVKIATGRTHQIRVHMQDHGTPIYGDDVYGMSDWNKALTARRGITRPLLHAQRLEIDHPVSGETMVFEAQVADDMMGVIKAIWPAGEKIEF